MITAENFLVGLAQVLTPEVMIAMLFGTAVGIVIGALPGFTAIMGLTLFLPVTFVFPPVVGLVLLSGIMCGGIYGGSISAVLIGIPGTPASVATTYDGVPLREKGQAALALGTATFASFFGGTASALTLMFLTPLVAIVALRFGAPEMFAIAFFGLSIVSTISSGSLLKGVLCALLGLLVGTVGQDPIRGYPRFTFGSLEMLGGFTFVSLVMGVFAIPQILQALETDVVRPVAQSVSGRMVITWKEFRQIFPALIRGSLIGVLIGVAPAAGPVIAAFIAYNEEKRASRYPEKFGTGIIEGVAAPEAANNGSTGGDLVLTLSLGLPGSAGAALYIGALMVHGLRPGPMLFQERADVVWALFVGFLLIQPMLLVLGLIASRMGALIIQAPVGVVTPMVIVFSVAGAFTVGNEMFDVYAMFGIGCIFYVMKKFGFEASPFVLALILGPLIESNWSRTLQLGFGSPLYVLTRPIALVLILVTLATFVWTLRRDLRARRTQVEEILARD